MINAKAFEDHVRGKPHKRRLKALETEPYTVEESERAAGMGSYVAPRKRKMDTMLPEGMKKQKKEQEDKKVLALIALFLSYSEILISVALDKYVIDQPPI